jgi:hypothetical protein
MKYQKKRVAEANNLILIFSNIYTCSLYQKFGVLHCRHSMSSINCSNVCLDIVIVDAR